MKTFLDWRHPSRSLSSPFRLGQNQRSLRVFYDRDTFVSGMASTLLDELQSAPDTEVERTQLDGKSFVEINKLQDDGMVVTIRRHDGYRETLVDNLSYWLHVAHREYEADKELAGGPWKNPEYRLRRLLLLDTANTHQADLFITDDPFLLEVSDIETRGTNVVSTLDGIAILGAHLRNRRVFIYRSSPDGRFTASLAGNSFYVACRRAIQDLSPILGSRFDDPAMKQTVAKGFHAIAPRTEQLLRARDRAVFSLLQPHDHDTIDDALFALDTFMLMLGSTFDSLAQMTNAILRLNSGAQFPDWRESRWQGALQVADPDLASFVAPNTAFWYMLQLHALLRNVVHGSIHQPVIYIDNMLPPEGFIVIPQTDKRSVRRAVRELGGFQRFGAIEQDNELWLRPGPTLEALLAAGMSFVNTVIRKLAQRLPSGDPVQERRCPDDEDMDRRCLYLAGLSCRASS